VGEVSPQSRRLAEHLQQELVTGLPREYRPVVDLGVKKGPFYVLFLSSMPSVLVESGFVTHARRRSGCATTATSTRSPSRSRRACPTTAARTPQ
jgi:N-acetylmuramoyl-L-alanine amidase